MHLIPLNGRCFLILDRLPVPTVICFALSLLTIVVRMRSHSRCLKHEIKTISCFMIPDCDRKHLVILTCLSMLYLSPLEVQMKCFGPSALINIICASRGLNNARLFWPVLWGYLQLMGGKMGYW